MKFIKLWLPVFLWCGLIFYLSSIPGLKLFYGVTDVILRKIAHMTEYFILMLLLYRAFRKSCRMKFGNLLFCSAFLSFLYVLSDEYHQTFILNRSGNLIDVAIDSIGILAAVFIYLEYHNRGSVEIECGYGAGGRQ